MSSTSNRRKASKESSIRLENRASLALTSNVVVKTTTRNVSRWCRLVVKSRTAAKKSRVLGDQSRTFWMIRTAIPPALESDLSRAVGTTIRALKIVNLAVKKHRVKRKRASEARIAREPGKRRTRLLPIWSRSSQGRILSQVRGEEAEVVGAKMQDRRKAPVPRNTKGGTYSRWTSVTSQTLLRIRGTIGKVNEQTLTSNWR